MRSESLMNELKELTELNSEFREEKEGLESEIEEFEFEMRKEKTLWGIETVSTRGHNRIKM